MAARPSAPPGSQRTDSMLAALSQVQRRDSGRSARAADVRRRVLEHGREQMREQGYFGCSLRHVAADVGTTTTTIMRRFGSKDGLLRAICDDSHTTALGWLADVHAGEPADALVAGVVRVLAEAERDPRVGDFLIAGGDTDFVLGRERAGAARAPTDSERAFFEWFLARAQACLASGCAPGLRPLALAEATVGLMERFLLNAYLCRQTGGRRYPYEVDHATVAAIVRLMLDPASAPLQRRRRPSSFRHASRLDGWTDSASDRLVAAAWVQFATCGYGGSTTAKISAGARTSESELFRRFRGGKLDLLREVYERCYEFVLADLAALDGREAGSALLDSAALLWSLYDTQPTLMRLLLSNSGNGTSLLIMPREQMTPDDRTALTERTDAYVLWFLARAHDLLPDSAPTALGTAAGQAVLGIAERALLTRHRDERLSGGRRLSRHDAIAPIERIVHGLRSATAASRSSQRRLVSAAS